MPINWNAVERAEQQAEEDYAAGRMTYAEYLAELRAIQDDVRGVAEEDAEQAYRDAMGWY